VAALRVETRSTQSRAFEVRLESESLRLRTRDTLRRSRAARLARGELRSRLVVPSPWSELPWRLPPPELRQVLVALPDRASD
jgi:hypothetical protein